MTRNRRGVITCTQLVNASLVAGVEDVVYPNVAVASGVVIRRIRATVVQGRVGSEMVARRLDQ